MHPCLAMVQIQGGLSWLGRWHVTEIRFMWLRPTQIMGVALATQGGHMNDQITNFIGLTTLT